VSLMPLLLPALSDDLTKFLLNDTQQEPTQSTWGKMVGQLFSSFQFLTNSSLGGTPTSKLGSNYVMSQTLPHHAKVLQVVMVSVQHSLFAP